MTSRLRGRFSKNADRLLEALNVSIDFDKRLATQDIAGARAHCRMLVATGIITQKVGAALLKGLGAVEKEIASGKFPFRRRHEDIHMNIEARLAELIGEDAAGRLHTARSRNDQVALDLRLYMREGIEGLVSDIRALQQALTDRALAHAATIMPGFTHMQNAQPVTFGHHCLAYVEMLARDAGRFTDAEARMNESPLGAGALAGVAFPIDPAQTAKALGFARPCANSLDAVSDRDFVLETLAACALCAQHLSRLAEEIILWCAPQYDFLRLSDRFATGSSIMPQKRNPDAAELIRARTGRITGALVDMLIVMKALPLAYAKDMQQDKEPVFMALDGLSLSLQAMAGMVGDMEVNEKAMQAAAERGFSDATDLADWLVREAGVPFREAHRMTAKIVARAEALGVALKEMPLGEMQKLAPRITESVYMALGVEASVRSRSARGGTAPKRVAAQARRWQRRLARIRGWQRRLAKARGT